MLERRLKTIQEHLNARGVSSIEERVEVTCSSPATVRRDLAKLETDGVIERTHGGARLADASNVEVAFGLRESENLEVKRAIDRAAHALLIPSSTVLMDAGTTVLLKLMEMSLSYSQAYHPLEYRHSPISLIDECSLAVMLYSSDWFGEETKLVGELREKGARVIGFGGMGNLSLPMSDTTALRSLIALPALQWLGERVAQGKGLNTREPRHLTKVVVLT